jgi:hypothetical protein
LTNIIGNLTSNNWTIISYKEVEKVGKILGFYNGTSTFPLGYQDWYLKLECTTKLADFLPAKLKLSKV